MSLKEMNPNEVEQKSKETFARRLELISEKQKKEVLSIPKSYQKLAAKVFAKEATPKQMMKLKCLSCVGYEDAQDRISNCNIDICAIHKNRPYQS